MKEFIADSYFKIGSSHEVCQDYALDSESGLCVVLSDGCSSNHHSDFGSRIICKTALNFLSENKPYCPLDISHKALCISELIGLERSHLNATLLSVSVYDSKFNVTACGDGLIVARDRITKDLYVVELEYPSGAPFYPSYLSDSSLLEGWKTIYSPKANVKTYWIRSDGSVDNLMDAEFDEGFKSNQYYMFEESFDCSEYDLVAVLSDGIHSFQKTEYPSLPYSRKIVSGVKSEDIIPQLFDFKQMNGVFVRRRCNKFFEYCSKNSLSHYDDFSFAAIYSSDEG
jgi:hypothetical protein